MRKIIIFDGVERIGKTTLIEEVGKRCTTEYEKVASLSDIRGYIKLNNSLGSKALFDLISLRNQRLLEYVSGCKSKVIFVDRWFPSIWVYQLSFFNKTYNVNIPIGAELFLLIGPDDMDFYVENNSKYMAKRAYLDNRLFKKVVNQYQMSPIHKCDIIDTYSLKKGVTLYHIR